jgi:ElaA protein
MTDTETTCEIKAFDELTPAEMYAALHLRNRVFVVQQQITDEPDVDGRDPECHHALLWLANASPRISGQPADRQLVGTARIFTADTPAVVGRVAVTTDKQRQGFGTTLMRQIQSFLGERSAELHAQAYLEDWYRRLGWTRRGSTFQEAGIDHVMMQRNVDSA